MTVRPAGLSKSKLQSFRQCPKRLYLEVHGSRLGVPMPEHVIDPVRAKHGEDVGQLARRLYGPGEMIGDATTHLSECLSLTQATLAKKTSTVFEATFNHDGVLIRADVLKPVSGGVDVVEVKSSTLNTYEKSAAKQETLTFDCAIQHHTLDQAGLKPKSFRLAMVNSEFVYKGEENYEGLLAEVDVSGPAAALAPEAQKTILDARRTLAGEVPAVAVGHHCTTPYECPFQAHCAPAGSEYPSRRLLTLRNRRNAALIAEVEEHGWEDLRQVPRDRLSDPRDVRIWSAVNTGKPQLDREAVNWAKALPYPRYYIDFETIQFAVPIWIGTRPYEQIPFQWSCHIEHADGRLEHAEFLADGTDLPLRAFAETLLKILGTSNAPVLVYNAAMEATCLKRLAARFTDLGAPIEKVLERIQDLLPVMRDHYYHREMDGSWSIKAVLPTIAPELSYAALGEVQDGGGAQWAFLQLLDPSQPRERQLAFREGLLRYCAHDTLAMVKVAQFLA